MLKQQLRQKMLQKLSPQQILLMKLLQIPNIALEQRIKQEIENNPVLEYDEGNKYDDEENFDKYDDDNFTDEEYATDPYEEAFNEIDFNDYLSEDDIPSYKTYANNYSPDDEHREIPLMSGTGFHDHLINQLELKNLTEQEFTIGTIIIGNVDNAGYLKRSVKDMVNDIAFYQGIETNVAEVEKVLKVVQSLDPPGVAARNLQECLLIQLKRHEKEPMLHLAIDIIELYFQDFTKKHFDKIQTKTHCTDEELKDAMQIILRLNPKPGSAYSNVAQQTHYIIPDFIIENKNGKLELSLNQGNMPELRLNKTYLDMMANYNINKKKNKLTESDKNAAVFIKQKVDSAKWFVDALKQRQNTLMLTMQAIMDYQYDYFLEGDETLIKPMILKDIAEMVGLDFSTISRVANSKYVQTPFGTFLLKSFFSEAIENDKGELVSTREIKKILQDCVDNENKRKPYTDEQLTNILKKKGYPIARRTVAKYRDQLNIPVARLRKEI